MMNALETAGIEFTNGDAPGVRMKRTPAPKTAARKKAAGKP